MISHVKYESSFSFIGFFIVIEKYRHQGFGRALWESVLSKNKTISTGLDSVLDQKHLYQKIGFNSAYHTYRFQLNAIQTKEKYSSIQPASTVTFNSILDYDTQHFTVERASFLKNWLKFSLSYVYLKEKKIKGIGCIRPCKEGYRIGPLFADTPSIAHQLLETLLSSIESNSCAYIDVPEYHVQNESLSLLKSKKVTFETVRMYQGSQLNTPIQNIYGITSLELG